MAVRTIKSRFRRPKVGRRRALSALGAAVGVLGLASAAMADQQGKAQDRVGCLPHVSPAEPQSGYTLEGTTLLFPTGATHQAEHVESLAEVYGLVPVEGEGAYLRTRFHDRCGNPYQVGYRIEGNTLHFPDGTSETLEDVTGEEAEARFREQYGLIGERERLIRTQLQPPRER